MTSASYDTAPPVMSRLEAASAEEAVQAWRLQQALMRAQRSIAAAGNEQRKGNRIPIERLRWALDGAQNELAIYEAVSICADRLRAEAGSDLAEEIAWNNRSGPYSMTPGGNAS